MPVTEPSTKPARGASKEEVVMGEHLAELRGRIVFLTWVAGLSWTLLALVGGMLVIGMCDWLIHLDDPGTRLLLGLALLSGSGWMLWRHLIGPLRVNLTGSFLASRVENQYPDLQNRVLSAVEFLQHRYDEKLGSTELQKAVVGQALNDLIKIDPSEVAQVKPIRMISIAGLVVCGLAGLTVLLNPIEAAISVERLAFPFARIPWPRAVELQFVQTDLSPVNWDQKEPIKIARGDTLELYVVNSRGRLPERVWFENRSAEDGPIVRESLRQSTLRDANGKSVEAAIVHWVATRGPMYFRASGGDDNVMPFYQVEVVPPPTIKQLQVKVTPPTYSERPVEQLPPGVGHVQGLIGTRVDVAVTSDKPLKSAKLRIGEQPGLPITVDDDGCQFTTSFEIKEAFTTNYWFQLTDLQGFTDREAIRYELRGIADGIPEVSIEAPVTDILLTADAILPVTILAKDDLRLKEIRIAYQQGDDENFKTIPLFDRITKVPSDSKLNESQSLEDPEQSGPQRLEMNYQWKMADLQPEPGTKIVFRGEATDDFALGQKHVGKSIPRTITIVSGADKQKELAGRVGELLDDLKQAIQQQKQALQQTHELQTQLQNVGELRAQDVDQLGRTELDQRQAASRLSNPTDGVETQARQLLDEMKSNHLNDVGTEERLERLATELNRLSREELPEAEKSLTQAQKLVEQQANQHSEQDRSSNPDSTPEQDPKMPSGKKNKNSSKGKSENKLDKSKSVDNQSAAQSQRPEEESAANDNDPEKMDDPENKGNSGSEDSADKADKTNSKSDTTEKVDSTDKPQTQSSEKSLESTLAEAQAQQTRSLESLQDLEESLAEWRDRRDISRDLNSVIAEQESILKESSEISQQTMSKSSAELSKQENAELNKLSLRQIKVAEQLEQFRKQLGQAANAIQKNDPDAAEKLNEAGQELKDQATASKLREAADDISDNKMGEAAQAQQKALEELRDIVKMMKHQSNEDTEQFLKQTQEALQEIQELRDEQQKLADQAQDLAKQPASPQRDAQMQDLMEKQEALAERMVKAERKLEKLRLRGPADMTHRARKRLNEMMKHLQDSDDADEMQAGMEEALEDLEQAERELVLEKRIAQERLAFEQLEKIEDELKSLKTRQQAVIEETERLNSIRGEQESLSRGQLKTLKELSETEHSLQHVAEQMQQQMAAAEVFSLVLKRLGRTLMLAADRLSDRDTSKQTLALENDAIRKIDNLLAVLKQEQQKQKEAQQPEEKPEQLGQEPQPQEEKAQDAQPPGDTIPQLAELKLLKSLQEEYLERTELLETFRDKQGKLPPAMEAELNELAHEQAELADYARNLVAKLLQKQAEPKEAEESTPQPKEKEKDKPDDDPTKIDL